MIQGVFLCTLGFWVPKLWNMALNKGIWDPKRKGTNSKGTNLKSLNDVCKDSIKASPPLLGSTAVPKP